jgi:hypothetical protein
MNCPECLDNLVACAEGLLDPDQSRQCRAHLETCVSCRAEYTALTRLQQRLAAHGHAAAGVSLAAAVMHRIRAINTNQERNSIMSKLFTRWGFGLSAAAAAVVVALTFLLVSPRYQAGAAEVLARGAKSVARLSSVHLRGRVRTAPQDNFSSINPNLDFVPIEVWKQFEPELMWRIEKPGRVAVMDGQSTVLFIKSANFASKVARPTASAFDTDWLHKIANLSDTIAEELKNARAQGWKMDLEESTAPDGRTKSVVTIEAKSGLPDNDYLKNKFFEDSDTRRVYRFDAGTGILEAVQIYLVRMAGEVLILDVDRIDCNQPIDAGLFQLELPGNVLWDRELPSGPNNERYAALTVEQAARAFFEACARQDWNEAGKFCVLARDPRFQESLGGLSVVRVGESFASAAYPGRFVPYEVRLKNGETKKFNLALKKDKKTGRWFVDGGI